MEGYFLTQDQCNVCEMPLMEKAGFSECVVCPVVTRKAKKRASQKRQVLLGGEEKFGEKDYDTSFNSVAVLDSEQLSKNGTSQILSPGPRQIPVNTSPNETMPSNSFQPKDSASHAGRFPPLISEVVHASDTIHQGKESTLSDSGAPKALHTGTLHRKGPKDTSTILGKFSTSVPMFGSPKEDIPDKVQQRACIPIYDKRTNESNSPRNHASSHLSDLNGGKFSFDISKVPSSITGDHMDSFLGDHEHINPYVNILKEGLSPPSNAAFNPISPIGSSEVSHQETDV